jgi:hypothetical protein
MAFESLTDDKIMDLLNCPKRLSTPHARKKIMDGNEQVNYKVIATDGSDYIFQVYLRQNLRPNMEKDFSCGISWISPSGEAVTLKRYNGASHSHKNHLEGDHFGYTFHIHFATEKYIRSNRKADGFAKVTDRYNTLNGAFHCLVTDCKISGIRTEPDNTSQTHLFD